MGTAGVSAGGGGGGGLVWTDPDLANASYDNVSFSVASQQSNSQGITFKSDGTKFYVVSSTQGVIYAYDLSTAWDVSTASYNSENFDASSEDSAVTDLIFKPDGTKMYVVGRTNDNVYQYSLSTAWDVSTASYDSKSVSVASQETTPEGVTFKSDGTSLYVVGRVNDDIFQYDMTTAWDVSTASYASKSVSLATGDPYALFMNPNDDQIYYSDNTDFIYEYNLSTVGDISTASLNSSFSVSSQSGSPRGFTFKPDGSKMYVLDYFNNTVFQYTTPAAGVSWTNPDLTIASQDATLDVSAQGTTHSGLNFNSDGTKMYATDASTNSVYQYGLSTAWDLSTASYNSVSFSVASQETQISDVTFNTDGSKMYIVGTGSDSVHQYSLSTNYDISTASYDNVSLNVQSQEASAEALVFKPDGSKLYVAGVINDSIREYSLSTNFDLSTASYNSVTSSTIGNMYGIYFNPDGTKLFNVGVGRNVRQYSLTTGFDLSTISYDSILFSYSGIENNTRGVFFKPDGSKMYFIGYSNNRVYQYSVAAPSWTDPDIANASYDSVSFSVASQEPAPSGLFFKPDGTKMYVCGTTGSSSQKVHEYDLSTAWNPSTATHNQSLNVSSVGATEATPQGIFFKDDGTKMFIVGNTGDAVHEYTLSTAWDISSGSFVDSTTVSGQTTNPVSLCFKSDGTRLYTINLFGSQLYQYDLSTAWDASTLSYNNVVFDLDAPVNASSAKEVSFNPDGTKMWAIFDGGDRIAEYDLSTAWDVSSASYNSTVGVVSFSQETTPQALFFKDDGSKMYIIGTASDTVYQYST
jgi:sugar lactone lactonase YvrE